MNKYKLALLETKAKAVKNGHLSVYCDPQVHTGYWVNVEDEADAEFIAAANPAVVLDLIAEIKQLKRERIWLAKSLAGLTGESKGTWLKIAWESTI